MKPVLARWLVRRASAQIQRDHFSDQVMHLPPSRFFRLPVSFVLGLAVGLDRPAATEAMATERWWG